MSTEFTFAYRGDDVGATIIDTGEGFRLHWTDYVANDWEETYPEVDAALARLALLIRSCATDRCFLDTEAAEHHTRWWDAFTEGALHP